MPREEIILDSYQMFKPEDGYYNVTTVDDDAVSNIVNTAMIMAGYSIYSVNRTVEGRRTITFVTNEKRKVLHEAHLAACRNSLGGIIPESLKQVLGKMAELGQGTVAVETYFKTIVVPYEEKPQ